jgi:voltage-gated potassium channel
MKLAKNRTDVVVLIVSASFFIVYILGMFVSASKTDTAAIKSLPDSSVQETTIPTSMDSASVSVSQPEGVKQDVATSKTPENTQVHQQASKNNTAEKQMMTKRSVSIHVIHWKKETILLSLALVSVLVLVYEELVNPGQDMLRIIDWFDFVVACIFLLDFFVLMSRARNKKQFIWRNWYLLVASLPLYTTWAAALRGLRVLRFIRLVRIGEHLDYSYLQNKRK